MDGSSGESADAPLGCCVSLDSRNLSERVDSVLLVPLGSPGLTAQQRFDSSPEKAVCPGPQ